MLYEYVGSLPPSSEGAKVRVFVLRCILPICRSFDIKLFHGKVRKLWD